MPTELLWWDTKEEKTAPMLRATPAARFRIRVTGYYLEDHINDHNAKLYYHPRQMKHWYAKTELRRAHAYVRELQDTESENHNEGRHHSGDGPFERELARKGIPVEKYPLPTTTTMRRLHEMTVLRRDALEKRSAVAVAAQRERLRSERPSQWYDESDGPLNQSFLRRVQKHYTETITELPEYPLNNRLPKSSQP
jgi:hypothetical protein